MMALTAETDGSRVVSRVGAPASALQSLRHWEPGQPCLTAGDRATARCEIAAALAAKTPAATAVRLVTKMLAAYPSRAADTDQGMRAYLSLLVDELVALPAWAVEAAIPVVWRTSKFRPSVAEVLEAVHAELTPLTEAANGLARMDRYIGIAESASAAQRQRDQARIEAQSAALAERDRAAAAAWPAVLGPGDFEAAVAFLRDQCNWQLAQSFLRILHDDPANWCPALLAVIRSAADAARGGPVEQLPDLIEIARDEHAATEKAAAAARRAAVAAELASFKARFAATANNGASGDAQSGLGGSDLE